MTGSAVLVRGDALRLPLRDDSVDLIVTSPPYFAARQGMVVCQCGADHASPTWPEWVTDEVLDAAYHAAHVLQTARGNWHKRNADRRVDARLTATAVTR